MDTFKQNNTAGSHILFNAVVEFLFVLFWQ